ncbi:hypothetical protein H6P81_016479 [Aristolochia fimbriata]|uniref:Putative zinc-finger domain-containing protein n=1 Tax=Aristolochia fimbriata TaxID=158543 RepID=A0AAV7E938_ARIFI|nr:hypothetical protein H6P81_016479 [Aristolochia fimbriata]
MAEIDELRARVIASMPVSANPDPTGGDRNVDGDKEEGELSSSDDEALISSQRIQLATSKAAEPQTVGNQNGVDHISGQGKYIYKSKLASTFHAPDTHSFYSKHAEKKQLPSKRSSYLTSKGHAPPNANDKFVIKFSDETESDSDEGQPSKAEVELETKYKTSGLDGLKKLEASALPKPNVVPQAGKNHFRVMQKKIPSTHASISAVPQIKHLSSWTSQAFLSEKDPYVRKHESNKMVAGKRRGYMQVADSTHGELESLRQQIAMRENELKHKNVPQSKERCPSSDDDFRPTTLASVGTFESTRKKPNKKRQKVGGPSECRRIVNGPRQFLASNESNKESAEQVMDSAEKGKHADVLVKQPNIALTVKQGHKSCVGFTACEGDIQDDTKLHINSNLAEKTMCADGGIACTGNIPSVEQSNADRQKLRKTLQGTSTSCIFQPQFNSKNALLRSNKHCVVTSGDRSCQHTASGAFNVSADDGYLSKCKDHVHLLNHNRLKSLMKEEEILDKELEDARELRHKCELEEISALKAYRKAQRALINANHRCNYLYYQRDLLSIQLRTLQMEETSSSWSPALNKQGEIELGVIMEDSKADADQLPNLSRHLQADYDEILDRLRCERNVLQTGCEPSGTSFEHLAGPLIVGSNPVSEPDGSTSELGTRYAAIAVSTPNHPVLSADEDEETFPSKKENLGSSLANEIKMDDIKEGVEVMREKMTVKSAPENMEDLGLLEASLRSELFQRLGRRTLATTSGLNVIEDSNCDRIANCEAQNCKDYKKVGKFSNPSDEGLMELDQSQMPDSKGKEGSERISDQGHFDTSCDDYGSRGSVDPEESTSSLKECQGQKLSTGFALPSADLKIVFRWLKVVLPDIYPLFQTRKNGFPLVEMMSIQDGFGDVIQMLATEAKIESLISSAGDAAVNPFWPLCMFELRGQCNNDECPWQHARDYHKRNLKQLTVSPMSVSDVEVESTLSHRNAADLQSIHRQSYITVPTYWIGPQLIKVNSFSSGCLLARNVWQYTWSDFCTFFGIPFLMQRVLPPDVPCLCSKDGHPGNQKSWKGPSFYHQIQDDSMKQLTQGSGDVERILELSIDIFNQGAHELGMKEKALAFLSRCLEAQPNSVVLWIVYLHIYYSKDKGVRKDDMMHLAIQYNDDSYELWLLYINSRMQLHSRLEAYDTAIREFISKAHSSSGSKHASSCLVDLLLEMLDFLCMSGNADKAISRINELLYPAPSHNSSQTAISDVFDCLTVPDKCTLWVCLVYIVVYKKLPEAVLQRFEFEQECPSGIEWLPVQLTVEEKGQALNLLGMAVHAVVSLNGDSSGRDNETEAAVRAEQLLCVSHVRCVAALEGFDCCNDLLVRYMKLYPTCYELSLMWARMRKDYLEQVAGFEGFEKVLVNWPKEEPGIQCIWNQYAEFALENATVTLVKNLMIRWFTTFHTVQNKENVGLMERVEDSPSFATSNSAFHSIQRDEMFGLLNLSLYHVLHDNLTEARVALDKALKLAIGVDFILCIKAHALFQIFYEFDVVKDIPAFITGYLTDVRASTKPEPLSRRFLKSMKRSRTRVLVENFLGPVSFDSSVINSILEILYGPSLLPDNSKLEDLVDFVEALMLILPTNYKLALSACKFIQSQNLVGAPSASFNFWGSSLLVNSIFQAFPVAPEQVWVEAAEVLGRLETENFPDRFHQVAVLVYPFSVKLWQSYYKLCKTSGNEVNILKSATERGIVLG